MAQWVADAKAEPAEFEELDVEFCAGHASSSLRAMRLAALVCQNSVPIRA